MTANDLVIKGVKASAGKVTLLAYYEWNILEQPMQRVAKS